MIEGYDLISENDRVKHEQSKLIPVCAFVYMCMRGMKLLIYSKYLIPMFGFIIFNFSKFTNQTHLKKIFRVK